MNQKEVLVVEDKVEKAVDRALTPEEKERIILMHTTKRQRREAVLTRPVEPSSDVNRNDKCPCGSGIKYKKCCGS